MQILIAKYLLESSRLELTIIFNENAIITFDNVSILWMLSSTHTIGLNPNLGWWIEILFIPVMCRITLSYLGYSQKYNEFNNNNNRKIHDIFMRLTLQRRKSCLRKYSSTRVQRVIDFRCFNIQPSVYLNYNMHILWPLNKCLGIWILKFENKNEMMRNQKSIAVYFCVLSNVLKRAQ